MDKTTALNQLQEFLNNNPTLKPTEGFTLSEPREQIINNQIIYYFVWTELSGQIARGGHSYYVMPDGKVIVSGGGTGRPDTPESVYSRWQNQL